MADHSVAIKLQLIKYLDSVSDLATFGIPKKHRDAIIEIFDKQEKEILDAILAMLAGLKICTMQEGYRTLQDVRNDIAAHLRAIKRDQANEIQELKDERDCLKSDLQSNALSGMTGFIANEQLDDLEKRHARLEETIEHFLEPHIGYW